MSKDNQYAKVSNQGVLANEPNVEALMKKNGLMPDGWDQIENFAGAEGLRKARNEAAEEIQKAYLRVFSSSDGRKVLDHLLDQTLRCEPYKLDGSPTMEHCTVYGLHRSGQNYIMIHILKMMQQAMDIPDEK